MLRLFSRRNRPMHLGRYPMEKLKRADRPTTVITDDVKRVPKRADFFVRAMYGDLGKKPAEEIKRFVMKQPLNRAIARIHWRQVEVHRGNPAPEVAPLPNNPKDIAEHIKSMCYFLDADIVGICEMPEYAWYSHDIEGDPVEAKHKYAIVIVIDQGYDTMSASSGDDWISGAQSYRAYLKGSTVATIVADYIRRLGYPAQAHSNADGEVLQIPLMLHAGLGEMSRIGELVLNPFIGPRHKTAVVTTDLPMEVDKPIDFGLQDFCDKCQKCARECPAQAIPYGDKVLYNGYEIWKPDVGKCTTYRVTNLKGSACGRCMKMCPWNKEGILAHRIAMWMAIKWPWTRRFFIWADDFFQYGKRNPVKKWWWDLETNKEKRVVRPEGVNQDDLHLERRRQKEHRPLAFYPVESFPSHDEKQTRPLDRKQGLEDGRKAAEALRKLKEKMAAEARR